MPDDGLPEGEAPIDAGAAAQEIPVEPAAVEPALVEEAKQSRLARLKVEKEKLAARAIETRASFEARRPQSEWIDSAFSAFERDVATGGGVLSGAVAFRVFLFQVPYVFFFVVASGYASQAGSEDATDLARSAGIGGLTAKAIQGAADLSGFERVSALVISGFALFWGARGLVKVLRIVHSLVWGVTVPKLKSTSRAALVLIGLVTITLAFAEFVGWLRGRSFIAGLVATILYALVPAALWLLIASWMPREECPWWALLPGAIVFGVGVEVLHLITVYWIAPVLGSKTETYGAIGGALSLLFWAYLLGRLMIASAVINATRWRIYQARHPDEPTGPSAYLGS